MLGDFASLDVQNTYRGSDAYEINNILILFSYLFGAILKLTFPSYYNFLAKLRSHTICQELYGIQKSKEP
ncbi:hypothetical protein [Piscirickettsia salmonis]|uniref:hypothetical protein n=1 Tax=Piscirickettsia salmonis TaxID=1238 RepID=UPI0012B90C3E|nr:hypothetical protein [Piscirickettsia salmonis]QHS25951.1 hypothetical protein GW538_08375 [Piscirickettsia salmonis]QHS29064.1 hypothetical protein GW537_08010 [Piscirickettsia salmonis]